MGDRGGRLSGYKLWHAVTVKDHYKERYFMEIK
jgi:hypothetical protein